MVSEHARGGGDSTLALERAAPQTATNRNWLGIAAVALGVVGGSVLALAFGALGLRAAREGKATNPRLALAGVALGAAWGAVLIFHGETALLAMGDSTSAAAMPAIGAQPAPDRAAADATTPLAEAAIGDCYRSDAGRVQPGGALVSVPGIQVVDCAAGHDAEVYYVTTLDGTVSPSDPAYADAGFRECNADAATRHIAADERARGALMIETYSPQLDGWDRGERYLVCGAVDRGADLHASFTTR